MSGKTWFFNSDYRPEPAYFLWVVILLAFINGIIWGTPFLVDTVAEWANSWPKRFFSTICHQQVDRTYSISGVPLAVCTRCTGFFAGWFFLFLFFSAFSGIVFQDKRKIIRIFLYTSLVLITDWAANLFSVWQSPDHVRMVIGFLWGGAAGLGLVFSLLVKKK